MQTTPTRRSILPPLWVQVLIGLVLGVAIGAVFPHVGVALKPLGDAFIRLIRMTLAPIIFATVVVGIARMGDIREVGRVGIKAILYFEIVSTLALVVGILSADLLQPGRGMNINPATLDATSVAAYTANAAHPGLTPFLLGLIPTSAGEPFVTGNMLQVILLGVLFGVALSPLRATAAPLLDILDIALKALFSVVRYIMFLAPLAALGGMAYTVGQYGLTSLLPLIRFTAELWIVSALFVVLILGAIARLAGLRLTHILGTLREELLITAATCSSEAVLAPVMLKLERMGCAEPVVGMVMPAGYTFNADGTSVYLGMATVFLAQATGMHLGLRDQLTLLFVLVLTSKGSGGVAGAGFIALAATIASMHQVPIASLVLLLGVERITNIPRAVINVIGSALATLVVARLENAYSPHPLTQQTQEI